MILSYFLVTIILLLFGFQVWSYVNSGDSASIINHKVREGNSCAINKSVSIKDPETKIQYTLAFCKDSCENGLPHTSDANTIMIPESYSKQYLVTTIQHEKIHLLQRRYPELWETWYTNLWSYRLAEEPPAEMPLALLRRRRFNPDIEYKPFAVWKDRWWSITCYMTDTPRSLTDAKTHWWDAKTGVSGLEPPPGWLEFFGAVAQDEHPHEMSAQMIANKSGNKNRILELTELYTAHFVQKTA
jgi:hypothetical protein